MLKRYVPDLSKDRYHVALTTWHWVPQVVVGLGLLAYGGLPYVLWGTALRTTFGLHCTWLVNSATHLWGSRRFRTKDDSTNNWWVALLSFGEGWHNNHHAHPVSMRHGLAWYEFDMNYLQIRLLEMVGLAWDLKVARIAQRRRRDRAAGVAGRGGHLRGRAGDVGRPAAAARHGASGLGTRDRGLGLAATRFTGRARHSPGPLSFARRRQHVEPSVPPCSRSLSPRVPGPRKPSRIPP